MLFFRLAARSFRPARCDPMTSVGESETLMRITIELEQEDLERFLAAFEKRLLREVDECDVLDAAKHALNTLPIGSAPAYVRKRIGAVQRFILMLEDEDWALPSPQRKHVLETLVYFSDPDDLIPDDIEVIGLLDDAIVLELLLRGQRHVIASLYGVLRVPSKTRHRLCRAERATRPRAKIGASARVADGAHPAQGE